MISEYSYRPVAAGQRAGIAMILTVFLASLVFLTLCMNRNVNVYDEGVILFDASLVLDGAIPHRDFYTNYGPAQACTLAALYKIFGASVLVERAWDTIVRGIIIVMVLIIVDQAAPRWLALLTAGASLVCLASFGHYGYPMFPVLAAALVGVAFLVPALTRRNPFAALTAAGACAGCATLFRYDVGLGVFAAECAILAFRASHERSEFARPVRDAIWLIGAFGAGFAVLVVPVGIAFALTGAIPDMLFQVVDSTIKLYVKMRALPFPRPWNASGNPTSLAVYLPLCFCAAAVPVMIPIFRRRSTNTFILESDGAQATSAPVLAWSVLTLSIVSLVFFAKAAVRVSLIGMAMSLVTTIALAAILSQSSSGRGRIRVGILGLPLVGAAAFTLSCLHADFNQFERNLAWATNPASWELSDTGVIPEPGSCRMPPGLERLACFRVTPAELETIRYVQQHTVPGEPVFVGLSHHDRILVNDVLLYFVADRRSVTKWHQFDPGVQTTLAIQQRIVSELRRASPRLIVLEATWDNDREPNDSAISSGVTELDDFIRSAFEPVVTFGENTVLAARRRSDPNASNKTISESNSRSN